MGYFSSIAKAIFKEYDRRIKRASLITEYGAGHGHAHGDPAEPAHAEVEPAHEDEGAEIVNVPRGTPVEQAKHE
jgi:hypothetical protein